MSRWLAASGAFVVSLDSTVNIAFPAMAEAFAVPPERVRWIIVGYVLTYALVSFAGGAAGDRFGHGRVFASGLGLSAAGFALAGAAPTFGWLIVGRVVQGVGGGLVYGASPALVTLASAPGTRGREIGRLNAAIGLALTVGPLLAGPLVERLGWSSVFYLRVPLALAVLAWAAGVPATRARATAPLVRLRDLARLAVVSAGTLAFLAQAGIFAIWLLAPFYLVERRGFGPLLGGVLFMLTPLGTTLGAPLAGRLAEGVGARRPVLGGLALEVAALGLLSGADPATSPLSLGLALFAAGLGVGVFQVLNMAALMAEFSPAQQGAAGGFAFLARTLGTVGGVLALAQVFAARRQRAGFDAAFAEAFLLAAALVALAAILAAFTGWRARARAW